MIFEWLVAYVHRQGALHINFLDHVNDYVAIISESSRRILDEYDSKSKADVR